MAKVTTSIRLEKDIQTKIKHKIAGKISFSEYVDTLVRNDLNDDTPISYTEITKYRKMIEQEIQNKFRDRQVSNILNDTRAYVLTQVVMVNEIPGSGKYKRIMKAALGWLDAQRSIATKFECGDDIIGEIDEYIIAIKNDDTTGLMDKTLTYDGLKRVLFYACKKYDKNYNTVYKYFTSRNLVINLEEKR